MSAYAAGSTYAFYKIDHPEGGKWTLHVEGANTTPPPPNPETLHLAIIGAADVTMGVAYNKANYVQGDKVNIVVTLSQGGQSPGSEHVTGGGPVTGALVQAIVSPPGGEPQTFTLTEGNNGIYTTTYAGTATVGSYTFSVHAQGFIPAVQDSFFRQSTQSVYVSAPFSPDAVIVGTNSVWLVDSSQVVSGSVIVNGVRSSGLPRIELIVGTRVNTPPNYAIKANRITVVSGATVASNVFYNTLTNKGTITGTLSTPLALPVISKLPPFQAANAGSTDISVANGASLTLAPGRYRSIFVGQNATLTLSGGTYDATQVLLLGNAQLLAGSASTVRLAKWIVGLGASVIGPAPRSGLSASQLVFYVNGKDTDDPSYGLAALVGPDAVVNANIYSPSGTISILDRSRATGAFIAGNVIMGRRVQVNLASAFTGLQKPESDESSPSGDVPTTFALEQNYPNPFNPTTTIKYDLPEDRQITLVVYNVLGQVVRTLIRDVQKAGSYAIQWNGLNDHGNTVGSGVYFYRIEARPTASGGAASFVQTRKMIFLK